MAVTGCGGASVPIAAASTSYPLLNIFWTMFEFFAWVAWVWLLIFVCMGTITAQEFEREKAKILS
jgi:hypothetical protein